MLITVCTYTKSDQVPKIYEPEQVLKYVRTYVSAVCRCLCLGNNGWKNANPNASACTSLVTCSCPYKHSSMFKDRGLKWAGLTIT